MAKELNKKGNRTEKLKGTVLTWSTYLVAQQDRPSSAQPTSSSLLLSSTSCQWAGGRVAAVRAHAPRPPPACRSPSTPWPSLVVPRISLPLSLTLLRSSPSSVLPTESRRRRRSQPPQPQPLPRSLSAYPSSATTPWSNTLDARDQKRPQPTGASSSSPPVPGDRLHRFGASRASPTSSSPPLAPP